MNEFFKDIIGKICIIDAEENYYDGYVIKDISDSWLVAADEDDPEEVAYVNMRYVYSIEPVKERIKNDDMGFFMHRKKERKDRKDRKEKY